MNEPSTTRNTLSPYRYREHREAPHRKPDRRWSDPVAHIAGLNGSRWWALLGTSSERDEGHDSGGDAPAGAKGHAGD